MELNKCLISLEQKLKGRLSERNRRCLRYSNPRVYTSLIHKSKCGLEFGGAISLTKTQHLNSYIYITYYGN